MGLTDRFCSEVQLDTMAGPLIVRFPETVKIEPGDYVRVETFHKDHLRSPSSLSSVVVRVTQVRVYE